VTSHKMSAVTVSADVVGILQSSKNSAMLVDLRDVDAIPAPPPPREGEGA